MTIPCPAAERMRRHRDRRREGLCCLFVELRDTEIDALIRKELLKPESRHDQNAIADALYDHLERTLDYVQTSVRGDRNPEALGVSMDPPDTKGRPEGRP